MNSLTHSFHALLANHGLGQTCRTQCQFDTRTNGRNIVSAEVAHFVCEGIWFDGCIAQIVCQISCVDFHRAGGAAQAIGGTSHVAVIYILLLKSLQACIVFARGFQTRYFALHHDALTRRHGEATTHAVHFAEATFHTLVDMLVGQWEWFKRFHEAIRVVVENHARIENVLWVEQVFHFLHHRKRFWPPLCFHEWSHISTCTVLSLE